MTTEEKYMYRCLQLAKKAAGYVAPNPMVGAVLVHGDCVIGEGYHMKYGEAHAEVNCIASVQEKDRGLVSSSTLYVSLEPCAHHGKTPPCTDLVIANRIPRVVIGIRDPFAGVNGKGIGELERAGVDVKCNVLADLCSNLNRRFLCFHHMGRPYIVLKWAQTADGFIGSGTNERLMISNDLTNRLVHKWRSEEAAILVGTRTARLDNPALTLRHWPGARPLRVVVDLNLELPPTLKIFDGSQRSIVFNHARHEDTGAILYYKLDNGTPFMPQFLTACRQLNIQSVMVEGGAKLLQSFIDADAWDEARVITNRSIRGGAGVAAPVFGRARLLKTESLLTDTIAYFAPDAISR